MYFSNYIFAGAPELFTGAPLLGACPTSPLILRTLVEAFTALEVMVTLLLIGPGLLVSYFTLIFPVAPGAIVSEAEERVFGHRAEEYSEWVLERQCIKQRIFPESVAELVFFLISHSSDMITSQNFAIDGGW